MNDFLAAMIAEFLLWLMRGFGFSLAVIPVAVWLHTHGVLH